MKRVALLLVSLAIVACIVVSAASTSGPAKEGAAAPVFGVTIPVGYRSWELISVTQEEGDFNQLRAQLGNDIAIKAYRQRTLPFPDGSIVVALHWKRVPSDEDNKVFGRDQAFVAGSPVNIQVMVKDSKSTPRRAAGGSGTSPAASLPTRRSTKPASPATSLPKPPTLSSPVMRPSGANGLLARTPTPLTQWPFGIVFCHVST